MSFVDDRAGEAEEEEERPEGESGGEEDEEAAESGGSSESDSSEEEGPDEYDLNDEFIAQEGDEDEEGAPGSGGQASDGSGAPRPRKARKKRRRRPADLEEEEYELLEEATGIRRRPAQQHKRIQRAREMGGAAAADASGLQQELFGASVEDLEDSDEDWRGGSGRRGAREGAEDGRGERPGRTAGRRAAAAAEAEPLDDFDDDDDQWIVDDLQGADEDGRGAARRAERRRRHRSLLENMPDVDPDALDEAHEIFGDVSDLLALHEERRREHAAAQRGRRPERGSEEEEEDWEVDRVERLGGRDAEAQTVEAAVEPAAVAAHYLSAADDAVRQADAPERHQLAGMVNSLAEEDLPAAAEWIWEMLVGPEARRSLAQDLVEDGAREVEGPPPSWIAGDEGARSAEEADVPPPPPPPQEDGAEPGSPPPPPPPPPAAPASLDWPAEDMAEGLARLEAVRGLYLGRTDAGRHRWLDDERAQSALRASIAALLRHLFLRQREVPAVGMWCKASVGELLALRRDDQPATASPEDGDAPAGAVRSCDRRMRRWDVLYEVQGLAQRWLALQRAKGTQRARAESLLAACDEGAASEASEADSEAADKRRLERAALRASLEACRGALADASAVEHVEDAAVRLRMLSASVAALADAGATPGRGLEELSLSADRPRRPAAARARRTSAYDSYLSAGLVEAAAEAFGLTADQIADNVETGFARHAPAHPSALPAAFAAARAAPPLRSAEAVAAGLRQVLATQLASSPAARRLMRREYVSSALLSTAPTAQGAQVLDPWHALGRAKRLRDKPLRRLWGTDLFLRAHAAAEQGLVELRLALPASSRDLVLGALCDAVCVGGHAPGALAWDAECRAAAEQAVDRLLLPAAERAARAALLADARRVVGGEVGDAAWKLAVTPPLDVLVYVGGATGEPLPRAERRIMAAVHGPGGGTGPGREAAPPTTFVLLDEQGALRDWLALPQLSGRVPRGRTGPGVKYDIFADARKGRDAALLRDFVVAHAPHAIALGGRGVDVLQIKRDLADVLERITDEQPTFFTRTGCDPAAWVIDDGPAAAWQDSPAARLELPDAAPIVRRGVALARWLLDPLASLCALWEGAGQETRAEPGDALRLHPLQEALSLEERHEAVTRALVSAVAQTGVDLNAAASRAWLAGALRFVPGLGPRKGGALLRAVRRLGGVASARAALWREEGVLGDAVFWSAAPALRVLPPAGARASANDDWDPLDDSRVHPVAYGAAVALARAATGARDDEVAVEEALARPESLRRADLAVVLRSLEARRVPAAARRRRGGRASSSSDEEGEGNDVGAGVRGGAGEEGGEEAEGAPAATDLATLLDVALELQAPYGDYRPPRQPPSAEEAFWVCLGETPASFGPGRKVEARVRYVSAHFARVQLPDWGGLEGLVQAAAVSSQGPVDCREYMRVDDVLTARVVRVDASQGAVELSTSSVALNDEASWERLLIADRDPHYVVLDAREQAEAERKKRQPAARKLVHRPIRHPLFHNVAVGEAAGRLLADGVEVGAALFRPSTRSTAQISLTMRMPGNYVWHSDVKEGGKSGASLQLGTPLTVEIVPNGRTETYEELDEVVARYVEPVAANLRGLTAHRKWRAGDWERVRGALVEEKQSVPRAVPVYCLCGDASRPGMFAVAYITNVEPHRLHFSVTPDGFHFRQKDFPKVDAMLNEFKRYMMKLADRAPTGGSGPGHHSQAPPLPPQQPLWGAAPAGGWQQGWRYPQGGQPPQPGRGNYAQMSGGGYAPPPGGQQHVGWYPGQGSLHEL